MPENATISKDLMEKVDKGLEAMLLKQAEMEKSVKDAADRAATAEEKAAAIEKAHADSMSEVRALMAIKTSEPEAKELVNDMGSFIKASYAHWRNKTPMPESLVQKAVVDFVTTADATAGYLVPTMFNQVILYANEMYGKLLALPGLRVLPVPAGVEMNIPVRSTNPIAAWGTQGVDMTEAEHVYTRATVRPKRLSIYEKASNEMLGAPGTGFREDVTAGFLQALVKAKEVGLFQGDDSGTHPHDGIFVASTVHDNTNLGGTIASLMTFIQESAASNPELGDENAVIFMPPAKRLAHIANLGVTSTNVMATFINKVFNVAGYDVHQHPACLVSTTSWATMFLPKDLIVADTGNLAFDWNPFGGGWTANETWFRAVTHMDWSLKGGMSNAFQKADFI